MHYVHHGPKLRVYRSNSYAAATEKALVVDPVESALSASLNIFALDVEDPSKGEVSRQAKRSLIVPGLDLSQALAPSGTLRGQTSSDLSLCCCS